MTDQHSNRGVQRHTVAVPADVPRQRATTRVRAVQRDTIAVVPRPGNRLRGVLTAGAVTSGWNFLVVALPILMVVLGAWWLAGSPGSVSDVVRTAGAVWLLGHGIPVDVVGLPIGLTPLALTIIILWRLGRAGRHTVRAIAGRDLPAVRATALAVIIGYTIVTTVVALLVDGEVYSVPVARAAGHAAVMALVASGLGALSESGAGEVAWHRIPVHLRRGLRTGALSTITLMAAGALTVGAALAVRGGAVTDTVTAYSGGALGLALLSLLYLPTVTVWASAYLLGPGFAVGVGTSVTAGQVDVMPLPVFPLFAAVPDAPLDHGATALLGVPLAIGTLHGVVLAIRSVDQRMARLVWSGIVSAVTIAVLTALLVWVAAGSLGDGRLARLGPQLWPTAGVAGVMVGGAVVVAALLARLFGARYRPMGRRTAAR